MILAQGKTENLSGKRLSPPFTLLLLHNQMHIVRRHNFFINVDFRQCGKTHRQRYLLAIFFPLAHAILFDSLYSRRLDNSVNGIRAMNARAKSSLIRFSTFRNQSSGNSFFAPTREV